MKTLDALAQYAHIDRLVIRSLSSCLYSALVDVDGEEHEVGNARGEVLTRPSAHALVELFDHLPVAERVLRHRSAYDEMVGQPPAAHNELEVPLGRHC